jgi:hypothetical protein
MMTEEYFFLNISPFGAASFLMTAHAFAKLVVPYMSRSHIDGIGTHFERHFLGLHALPGALPTGDKNQFFHRCKDTIYLENGQMKSA